MKNKKDLRFIKAVRAFRRKSETEHLGGFISKHKIFLTKKDKEKNRKNGINLDD